MLIENYLTLDRKRTGYICPFCFSGTGRTGTGLRLNPKTNKYHCFNCSRDYSNLDLYAKLIHDYSVEETTKHFKELKAEIEQGTLTMDVTALAKQKALKKLEQQEEQDQVFEETTTFELSIWKDLYTSPPIEQVQVATVEELIQVLQNHGHKDKNKSPCITLPTIDNKGKRQQTNIRPSRLIFADIDECTKRQAEDIFKFLDTKLTINWDSHSSTEELPRIKALFVLDKNPCTKAKYKDEVLKLYEEIENSVNPHSINEMTETEYNTLIAEKLKELQKSKPKATVKDLDCVNDKNEFVFKLDKSAISIEHAQYCPPLGNEIYITKGEIIATKGFKNSFSIISDTLKHLKTRKKIDTGYKELNQMLNGGFDVGLYVLGGKSGIGKTALCLQLADQIAKLGQKVLYFSYEMTASELLKRSFIRLSDKKYNMSSDVIKILSDNEIKEKYKEIGNNLYIFDTYKSNTLDSESYIHEVDKVIHEYIATTNNKPFVVIDYLQIMNDKEYTPTLREKFRNISRTLKQISTKHDITVLVVSSINRSSYNEKPSLDAFKECGEIEYSSNGAFILTELRLIDDCYKNSSPNELGLMIVKGRDIEINKYMRLTYDGYHSTQQSTKDIDSKIKTDIEVSLQHLQTQNVLQNLLKK